MASSNSGSHVIIDNADGVELQIPAVGLERGGEISISATNRFFKVIDSQGDTRWFLKHYNLNREGATIVGMETPRQGKWVFFYEEGGDKNRRFENHNNLFSFYTAIMTLDGYSDEWKKQLNDYNHDRNIDGISSDDSKVDLQNIYGQTFNGVKLLPSRGGDKRINTINWKNWYHNSRRTIVNIYIDNDDIYADMVLINFYNNVRILRDKLQWYDGSNWQDINLSATIPHQQWFQVEIDYNGFDYYGRGQKPTYIKVNGEEIDIASKSVVGGQNYYIFLGYGRSEKDSDYIKYSTLAQIPTGRIEELRGVGAKDEIVTIVRNLITPV